MILTEMIRKRLRSRHTLSLDLLEKTPSYEQYAPFVFVLYRCSDTDDDSV
jgi:hypothetical protein